MAEAKEPTRFDRIVNRLKNHPVVAMVLVLAAATIALSNLTDAADKLLKFFRGTATAAAETSDWPKYVEPDSLFDCITRGDVCKGNPVIIAGSTYRRSVILTQPGPSGHSEVSFDVVPEARRLVFTAGNPYYGANCANSAPMLLYVSVDGHRRWAEYIGQPYVDQAIDLPAGSRTITLGGDTADHEVACDDSAWAEVRFER